MKAFSKRRIKQPWQLDNQKVPSESLKGLKCLSNQTSWKHKLHSCKPEVTFTACATVLSQVHLRNSLGPQQNFSTALWSVIHRLINRLSIPHWNNSAWTHAHVSEDTQTVPPVIYRQRCCWACRGIENTSRFDFCECRKLSCCFFSLFSLHTLCESCTSFLFFFFWWGWRGSRAFLPEQFFFFPTENHIRWKLLSDEGGADFIFFITAL